MKVDVKTILRHSGFFLDFFSGRDYGGLHGSTTRLERPARQGRCGVWGGGGDVLPRAAVRLVDRRYRPDSLFPDVCSMVREVEDENEIRCVANGLGNGRRRVPCISPVECKEHCGGCPLFVTGATRLAIEEGREWH